MATPSSPSTLLRDPPLEAGPLPVKQGEIGYIEGVHGHSSQEESTSESLSLPRSHPADTSSSSSPPEPVVETLAQSRSILPSFGRKKLTVRSTTTVSLVVQIIMLLATTSAWIVVALRGRSSPSAKIFIYASFATAALVQLVSLERTVYLFRAERYAMSHPGEMMSRSLLHRSSRLSINPWTRLPLPTYAAVLYESGIATGDVEDVEIAILPPPAYGVTRGNRLITSGPISEELENQSRRARLERGESLSSISHGPASRPVSYASQNPGLEERCDGTRAVVLQETTRLE